MKVGKARDGMDEERTEKALMHAASRYVWLADHLSGSHTDAHAVDVHWSGIRGWRDEMSMFDALHLLGQNACA